MHLAGEDCSVASQQRTLNAGGSDEGFLDHRTLGSSDEYVLDCIPDLELPEHGDLGAKLGSMGCICQRRGRQRGSPGRERVGDGGRREWGASASWWSWSEEGKDWGYIQVQGLLWSFPPSRTALPS